MIFQLANGIAQSEGLPQNNSFTDVTRDSILSKLLQRETLVQKTRALRLVVRRQDIQINNFTNQTRLLYENNVYLKTALQKKDTIIDYNKKLTLIEKKKGRKKAVAIGLGGVALGIIIKSLF